jgi:hypothetical protein
MSKMSKRATLILVITVMLLSLFPVIPVKALIDIDDNVFDTDYAVITDGVYGDTVVVTGSGVTAGANVKVYWDLVQTWDGEAGLMNNTKADPDGTFEVWLDVPEAVNGNHYIWCEDAQTGDTTRFDNAFVVNAMIEMDPDSGLEGDKVTIDGYGFSDEEDIVDVIFDNLGVSYYGPIDLSTTPATPETDDLGSWTATFKVPDVQEVYRDYEVYAEDDKAVSTTEDFTVGASIALDVDEGPVGTVVEVSGRGFDKDEDIDAGEVTLDDSGAIDCYIIDEPVDVQSDGEFKLEIVIPQVSKVKDDYVITVTDGVETATAKFDVTGLAEIEVDPDYGVQGTKIDIEGFNFTQISGKEILLELWDAYPGGDKEADITDYDSDSSGEFVETFTVPAVSSGNYELVAIQSDYNIMAETDFRVGMIIVILSKTSGPSGSKITMTGTGFTEGNDAWNATFGGEELIDTGDVDTDGDLELDLAVPYFFVPTIDPGTYEIVVMDIQTEIQVGVDFVVTEKTTAWTDPLLAPNDYNITIEGSYFSEEAGVDLTFELYNVTDEGEIDEDWSMTVTTKDPGADTVTDEDGNFTGWWKVFNDETLSLGDYIINVTDENDMFAQIGLRIVTKTVDIEPRKPSFAIGQTVAFDIESSFTQHNSYIKIWTPDDELYWKTEPFVAEPEDDSIWVKVGTVYRVPYYEQTAGGNVMLLEDVPLGTWSWTWYDKGDDELDSGTFTVTEAPADILGQQITELTGDLQSLTDDFTGLTDDVEALSGAVTSLADSVSTAISAANAAKAAADDAADAISDIAEVANSAKTAADSAKSAADAAKDSADRAGEAASGLTTLVYGAIGASLIAALAAIVSLMQISRRIAG